MSRDHALNAKHAETPEVGDYWHEMFVPVRVVVGVSPDRIAVCTEKLSVPPNHWTWDVSKIAHMSREEFARSLRYSINDDKFWCDVIPRAHAWVRESVIADMTKRVLGPGDDRTTRATSAARQGEG